MPCWANTEGLKLLRWDSFWFCWVCCCGSHFSVVITIRFATCFAGLAQQVIFHMFAYFAIFVDLREILSSCYQDGVSQLMHRTPDFGVQKPVSPTLHKTPMFHRCFALKETTSWSEWTTPRKAERRIRCRMQRFCLRGRLFINRKATCKKLKIDAQACEHYLRSLSGLSTRFFHSVTAEQQWPDATRPV